MNMLKKLGQPFHLRPPSAGRSLVQVVAVGVLMVAQFLAVSGFLLHFQPGGAGFEQKGGLLLVYHVSRLGLLANLLVLCYSAGYFILRACKIEPSGSLAAAHRSFILCFFLGASALGLAYAILGLAGLLRPPSAFLFAIPILLFSYTPLAALTRGRERKDKASAAGFFCNRGLVSIVIAAAVVSIVFFILLRVLFIPAADTNIWEHYLHYYRVVLAAGSTQPNEVWHHFFNSKGGGLVFLASLLSDYFAVQVVSACFLFVSALIIYDILRQYCRTAPWAWLGVTLYFAYLSGDFASGAMFRVHGIILGYASLALWGAIWLRRSSDNTAKRLLIPLSICLFYFGFYQPAATAIFPAALLLFAASSRAAGERVRFDRFAILAVAVICGTTLVFLINWAYTGLPEITPMRLLWRVADQAKAAQVFGTGGIDFFLAVDNDLDNPTPWYARALWGMREPVSKQVTILTLTCLLVLLARATLRYRVRKPLTAANRLLVQVLAFTVPFSVFSMAIPSPSLYRMGLYTVVFVIVMMVVIWKCSIDILLKGKYRFALTSLIITLGAASSIAHAGKKIPIREWHAVSDHIKGKSSLKDAFVAMEAASVSPPVVSVAFMSEVRKLIGSEPRILSLTYDAGYSYLLPAGGVVSEPTYAIVDDPRKMLSRSPADVAAYLQARGIQYLLINLRSRVFSTLCFSRLLYPDEASAHLSLVYRSGDIFVLSLRDGSNTKPLPKYLLTVLELKRSGALNYPFADQLAQASKPPHDHYVQTFAEYNEIKRKFIQDVMRRYAEDVLTRVTLEPSKAMLQRALDAGVVAVEEAGEPVEPKNIALLSWRLDGDLPAPEGSPKTANNVATRFVEIFREGVYRQYLAELGPSIAALARTCDEQVPFAMTRGVCK
jgi:hypothetical protein